MQLLSVLARSFGPTNQWDEQKANIFKRLVLVSSPRRLGATSERCWWSPAASLRQFSLLSCWGSAHPAVRSLPRLRLSPGNVSTWAAATRRLMVPPICPRCLVIRTPRSLNEGILFTFLYTWRVCNANNVKHRTDLTVGIYWPYAESSQLNCSESPSRALSVSLSLSLSLCFCLSVSLTHTILW